MAKRIFLGWEKPILPCAARWFRELGPDLSKYLVVLPGRRAARRFRDLLAIEFGALIPPETATAGTLFSATNSASATETLLAWEKAIRESPRAVSRIAVVETFSDSLDLAEDLAALRATLAADGRTISDLRGRDARFESILEIEKRYREILDECDLVDPDDARDTALCDREIILIACADLNASTAAMLRRSAAPITALIHAPESESSSFDDLGVLITDAWKDRVVDFRGADVHIEDRPGDQIRRAVDTVISTIGLGDESMGPAVRRALRAADIPSHLAGGRPLADAAPVVLLRSIAAFSASKSAEDFSALIRHPDLNFTNAPTLCDEHFSTTFQKTIGHEWPGDTGGRMKDLYTNLKKGTGAFKINAPVPYFAEATTKILTKVYGDREATPEMERIAEILEEISAIPERLDRAISFSDAVAIFVRRMETETTADEGTGVEILGWLDLALDDAPDAVLLGFNEGFIPASRRDDLFLPESLRTSLGLSDNSRRYARDLYLLTVLLRSRRMTLVAGRRGFDGRPLKPSRLYLAAPEAEQVERVRLWCAESVPVRRKIRPGAIGFRVPVPVPPDPPLAKLRVTAFRDYLACPYRFYLKHILRLGDADDRPRELDAMSFGTLAHDVLAGFGRGEARDSTDAREISGFLRAELDRRARDRFGRGIGIGIVLQLDMLKLLFDRFAQWQAETAREGWVIEQIETEYEVTLQLDGAPFVIHGHIDRVDRCGESIRIIDYKTGDAAKDPTKEHRNRNGWINLQLPLYRTLLGNPAAEIGYVRICGDESPVYMPADLPPADEAAIEVIRKVRAGVFWPPAKVKGFDPFDAICNGSLS